MKNNRKYFTLFLLAVLFSLTAKAQRGEIIHVSIDDTAHLSQYIDFDMDGENDVSFYWTGYPIPPCAFLAEAKTYNDTVWPYVFNTLWRLKIRNNYGDTISTMTGWNREECGIDFRWDSLHPYLHTYYEEEYLTAVKLPLSDGKSCYGWVSYKVCGWPMDNNSGTLIFHEYAFCTVPDYPLRIGQTSFDWEVEETKDNTLSVHPNPTEGFFTVNGEDLDKVEVYNALGQCVFTQLANGNTMDVYLQNQPAGIYFVNVTNEAGKRYVKKVVKQ